MSKIIQNRVMKILIIFGLVGFGHWTGKLPNINMFEMDTYSVFARLDSVAGLEIGDPVKMHGLKIGRVADLRIDQDKQEALAKLKIKDDIQIYDDAFASIRMEGLIGKNYLSIDPGGVGDLLESGDIIIETESLIELSSLISKYAFGDVAQTNNNHLVRFVLDKKQD